MHGGPRESIGLHQIWEPHAKDTDGKICKDLERFARIWEDLPGKICKDLGRFAWKDLQGFGKICKDLGTSSKGHG